MKTPNTVFCVIILIYMSHDGGKMMKNEKNTTALIAEESPGVPTGKKKKLTGTQKILIIGFGLIIVTGIVLAIILLNRPDKTPVGPNDGKNFVIDENNLQEIVDLMEDKVAEGMFECNMNTVWTFKDSNSVSSDAYVANAHTNSKPIYFDVIIDDINEVAFTSTLIPAGNQLMSIKLDKLTKKLNPGTYPATCQYHLMDKQEDGTYKEYSTAAFSVNIIIQN